MSPDELRILKHVILATRRHNHHAWWQLKREIFDFGDQDHYPAQSMFERPAKLAVATLSRVSLAELYVLRERSGLHQPVDVVGYYSQRVVAEVVRRARIAAFRTENW